MSFREGRIPNLPELNSIPIVAKTKKDMVMIRRSENCDENSISLCHLSLGIRSVDLFTSHVNAEIEIKTKPHNIVSVREISRVGVIEIMKS